jgi:outer membrane protein W
MKKFTFFFYFFFFVLASAYSQKLYIKVNGGYHFATGNNVIGTNETVKYKTSISENITGTYGAGVTKAITVGRMINKNMALELGGSHLVSKDYELFYFLVDIPMNPEFNSFKQDIKTYARMSALTTSLVFTANGPRFQPYARVGLMAGKPKIFSDSQLAVDGHQYEFVSEESGKISLGFQGGIGFTFPVTAKWMLFTEATYSALSFSPEKSVLIKYSEGGKDMLSGVPAYHKETVYKDVVKFTDERVSGPLNNPKEELRYSSSFNAIGLQLGVRFNLL